MAVTGNICGGREGSSTGREGLLDLVGLLLVLERERVEVARAANLELNVLLVPLDFYSCKEE